MDRQTAALDIKKALSETVLLSDGRYGYVFSELEGRDTWECHVCCRVISTERAMLVHLSHPHHKNKMRVSHHPPKIFNKIITKEDGATFGKKNSDSSEPKRGGDKPWEITDSIRPGEPVPPGMEDLVKKTCQLQEALDNHPGPLIGIEYIVELVSAESAKAEPKYICLLCEKKGDPRSLMVHLSSHNHSLRYISCFFRTAGNAINMIPKVRENRKGVAMAVHKISEEIEKHFGRLKPVTAVAETFAQQKYEILRSIDEQEHFRETPLTTFIEYCTPEKIKEYSKLAEAEFQAVKNKVTEEGGDKTVQANDRPENINEKCVPAQHKTGINEKFIPAQREDIKPATSPSPASKLSFSIGKPKRSFGQNNKTIDSKDGEKKDDDEVIFVESTNDPIEILSMSSISLESDSESKGAKIRMRSRSRSRSRGRTRGRLPLPRRRSPRYRSPISSRDVRYRNRSRSRSRGRYREKERYSRESRLFRESDRIYSREKRSRSKEREKLRYDRSRSDRDRFRRSISIERDRRRLSPYKLKHGKFTDRSPPNMSRLNKSSSPKTKKPTEYESKLDIYRLKLHDLEVEMDNKLKYYKDRPEKHPQYSEEWKNFWNRRYKELQQAGKDPNGYDFKPEWIIFWEERVRILHEEELLAKKEELKSLLPVDEKGPSSDLQDISPPTPESPKDVTVDDIKNTWKALTGSDIKAPSKTYSPTREDKSPFRRSPSPWEDKNKSLEMKNSKRSTSYVDSPIVHCLRMLSVIEHQLGSLGPKALELLSRAIIMEKVKYNESMLLLQEPDVHIFFETVKEKIRGQLIAHVVARNLVNSCRTLISAIEKLLAAYPLKPKPLVQPRPTFSTIKQDPVLEAGGDIVNKMAVAQQIAEILVAQGRTDVSQQELEELINAVVGLASTSNTNVTQPPANVIAQLDVQQSTANSQINELLNGLITSAQSSASTLTQASIPLAVSIPEKPQEFFPEITNSFLQSNLKTTAPTGENASRAFADAVFAVKATVTEHTNLLTPVTASVIKDKPLFPIQQPSIEKEIPQDNKQISDEELKGQLLKFKLLSRDEQQNLILLLKDLEGKEPERVEKLRKYVTLGLTTGSGSKADSDSGRLSPFSSRTGGTNPAPEEKSKSKFAECMSESDRDDDDDDYTVEDIYKSVSEKLRKKESERKMEFRINPEELEENSSSSRQSFINPPKELSSQSIDMRNSYPSSQQPKSDYSVYSVNELDKYSRTVDHFNQASTENSYKNSQWQNKNWDGPNSGNSVKSWPQNPVQDMYSVGRNTSYPGGSQYDNSSYSSLMPPPFVKNLPSGGQFYSNESDPSLMPMQHPPNDQYPPSTPQYGNAQNFQNPMYNNEAAPAYNNYQKMNQPYYRPY